MMETVHHGPERQQEGSHMLFGLHRESSSGHAGQTRRWGDVLGAVPGEGARDVPSLFGSVETAALTRTYMAWRSR